MAPGHIRRIQLLLAETMPRITLHLQLDKLFTLPTQRPMELW